MMTMIIMMMIELMIIRVGGKYSGGKRAILHYTSERHLFCNSLALTSANFNAPAYENAREFRSPLLLSKLEFPR